MEIMSKFQSLICFREIKVILGSCVNFNNTISIGVDIWKYVYDSLTSGRESIKTAKPLLS